MLSLIINEVLFWLRFVLFKYAISVALAYHSVIIGVCYTMNRVMGIVKNMPGRCRGRCVRRCSSSSKVTVVGGSMHVKLGF